MRNFLFYTCVVLLSSVAFGLYSSTDDVIELTPSTFDRVFSNEGVWFVEFYAPWCGHCKSLAPEWKRAATILKGVANIAAVNADEHTSLASQYSVKGFPTILMFVKDKRKTNAPYTGARKVEPIVREALKQVQNLVDSRLGGGSSGGSGGSDVIELTDSNFEQMVLGSKDNWLVEFFAPWCGHCKQLKPHWEQAAKELKGSMKLGAVDATVHKRLAQKYQINGFPTIKHFPAGSQSPEEYDGGRTADDIVRWAKDKADESLPAPELVEITSEEAFKTGCEGHTLCIISVFPSLYDCPTECRNKYLATLKLEAEKHKKQNWGWLWTEAMMQPKLEQVFDVGGSGYPAMVAVNSGKRFRTTLRGAFSEDGIHGFTRSLLLSDPNLPVFPVQVMPQIEKVKPWDGKDAPPLDIEEDDIDIDDLIKKSDL